MGESFVRWGVESDLTDYQNAVTASDLDPAVKARLTKRIDAIRTRHRAKPITFGDWVNYSDRLDELTDDGKVTPEEVEEMEQGLQRMETGR